MAIAGITPFSGQPTLTNPLSSEAQQAGNTTRAQSGNETQNTVIANEQASTTISNALVVEQTNETAGTGFNSNNLGGNIDTTA